MELPTVALSPAEVARLDPVARHIAMLNGLLFLQADFNVNHIPLTLLPSPFPAKAFQTMVHLQKHVNALYHRASCDHRFLEDTLKETVAVDDYLMNQWRIYLAVKDDMVQKNFLGLIRTDYMLQPKESEDVTQSEPKQIEVNLMASGLGSLSQKLAEPHRLLLKMSGTYSESEVKERVPDNNASTGLARGMVAAKRLYGNPSAVILFVIGDKERNIFDQRALEESVYKEDHSATVLRRTFDQLHRQGALELRGDGRRLFIDGYEVAVIYFRHGYSPAHFEPWTWEVKLRLERSAAIKCPSIQHMLVNSKRVQQALCQRSELEKFVDDSEVVDQLMATFAGQFDPRHKEHFNAAVADPQRYVLKPQREGGGNNFFGDNLRKQLLALSGRPELGGYILMERVRPPTFVNHALVPCQEVDRRVMVTELGTFGAILGDADQIHLNYDCGHLMRSKSVTVDEGGVYSGFSCLDSPLLI